MAPEMAAPFLYHWYAVAPLAATLKKARCPRETVCAAGWVEIAGPPAVDVRGTVADVEVLVWPEALEPPPPPQALNATTRAHQTITRTEPIPAERFIVIFRLIMRWFEAAASP